MARTFLVGGALLLLTTAAIHATGVSMVAGWAAELQPREAAALQLVWLSDSFEWGVAAAIWLLAAWKATPAWRAAASVAGLIPLAGGVGVMALDPTFFGGHLLLASVALAAAGLLLAPRNAGA